ncbi:glutathione S-transferase N-terminal domain-containing protein [Polyangium sp. y55x31]|uniref:glutathione S-transferase family protein n=1 Tax=Polyangium sp. y55x31 TaxID=3042688 RepID=UPI0024829E19|nr:glutathione S-transferase N-terminal domain-containing protein [Polyangium sp. y55x31]MDI1483284.1 glutathione S-transferase N-terminal domain-containing protein [Polyangium sp. y55x31]
MQLWLAFTSPFARKVRVAAHELGLASEIELVETDPWTDPRLRAVNPLAKVPTLILEDGEILYESSAICDYLDERAGGGRLLPRAGRERRRVLRVQGLTDGAATAAGRLFAAERRAATQPDPMTPRFEQAIAASLDALETEPLSTEAFSMAEVGAACLLGYLDFRWPERDWHAGRPVLSDWWAAVENRPSIAQTAHHLSTTAPRP